VAKKKISAPPKNDFAPEEDFDISSNTTQSVQKILQLLI
jgi:hypothetical protein